jgi:HAD superfamily hydrolase (TIGR01459 family)
MSFERPEIPILTSIAGISADRELWLCDVWGVLHNGVMAFPEAIAACAAFRARGGSVALVSNSPRTGSGVAAQLEGFGITTGAYDAIVTSGDATRDLVAARAGEPLFHLGPDRDRALFDGLGAQFARAEEARLIVCTGLFDDETETPSDYDEMLAAFAARNVPMICVNPDLAVERGRKLVPCAGALAVRYAALGQEVVQAGKPFRPIYDLALKNANGSLAASQILAIGDGIDTDIKGAVNCGIDAVYIASRVYLETANGARLQPETLRALFSHRCFRPIAALPRLVW